MSGIFDWMVGIECEKTVEVFWVDGIFFPSRKSWLPLLVGRLGGGQIIFILAGIKLIWIWALVFVRTGLFTALTPILLKAPVSASVTFLWWAPFLPLSPVTPAGMGLSSFTIYLIKPCSLENALRRKAEMVTLISSYLWDPCLSVFAILLPRYWAFLFVPRKGLVC